MKTPTRSSASPTVRRPAVRAWSSAILYLIACAGAWWSDAVLTGWEWWLLSVPLQISVLVLLTDLASGLVHWAEDRYGSEDLPILGPTVIRPNIEHHFHPRRMAHNSWIRSARMLLVLGAVVLTLAASLGILTWQWILVIALGVNVNEVHKWTHRTPRENGRLITWLQQRGWIQSRQHHGRHHRDPKESHYCTLTNWVNPVVDRIGLWRKLEWLLARTCRLRPRPDPSVRLDRLPSLP